MKVQQMNKPIIKHEIKGVTLVRNGRGFSKSELKEAGVVDIRMAKNRGIPIDVLRKTTKAENIEELRPIAKYLLNRRKTTKAEK